MWFKAPTGVLLLLLALLLLSHVLAVDLPTGGLTPDLPLDLPPDVLRRIQPGDKPDGFPPDRGPLYIDPKRIRDVFMVSDEPFSGGCTRNQERDLDVALHTVTRFVNSLMIALLGYPKDSTIRTLFSTWMGIQPSERDLGKPAFDGMSYNLWFGIEAHVYLLHNFLKNGKLSRLQDGRTAGTARVERVKPQLFCKDDFVHQVFGDDELLDSKGKLVRNTQGDVVYKARDAFPAIDRHAPMAIMPGDRAYYPYPGIAPGRQGDPKYRPPPLCEQDKLGMVRTARDPSAATTWGLATMHRQFIIDLQIRGFLFVARHLDRDSLEVLMPDADSDYKNFNSNMSTLKVICA